ncbi:efflux RND transporter periplasmic adaptor subunit [Marinilabilia salmonicolor]|jgi:multidrug efflux pump subunit AcrA (membrane-fusion protein)|uniref:RND family efflux transporter MFP subunit n=1 Tax=Marinilabilia salmonicolor TaxID=989 RepID=A0A2T0XPX8_9BACT|nr:HlyD family efflux transporter periplasmic adaptor subunit [Marinilabilia salmonicolor]PRZ01015.1 RND family efflux transporter MFP subunit [Marinilabilia salmonicolor]RCW31132.1 RND family efflux transporter MFP subunit [Marinilabilia salmonicolor]
MKRKIWIFAIAAGIVLAGVVVMFVLFSLKKEPKPTPKPQVDVYVKAETVQYKDLQAVVSSSGRLHALNEVVVSSEVTGRLSEGDVPFRNGQKFQKGQILAEVVNPEFPLGLKARKSRFLQSLAVILPDLRLDFPDSFSRWESFFENINIEKPLPAMPEPQSSKERIFLASRNIISDYYSILADQARLEKHQIRAPFTGAFNNIMQDPGVVVNPGSQLATIVRTDVYELEVPVIMDEVRFISVGDSVQVENDNSSAAWKGVVKRIGSVVNPSSQAVSVFVSVPGSYGLFDGMYLTAHLYGSKVKDVMEMPRNAVFNNNHVYVLEEMRLIEKPIEIVKRNDQTLFLRGLHEGEELVVEPLLNVTGNPIYKILR